MTREMRVLLGKEWKQVTRNRGALLTATIFPILFLLVIPIAQAAATRYGGMTSNMGSGQVPPGLQGATPESIFSLFTFPLFLVMGGLVVPSIAASYTVVSEREKRTVDLLLALPLSLGQIVAAKIGSVLMLALAITLPLVAIDFTGLVLMGFAGPDLLAGYVVELVGALAFSTSSAVAVSLLARDYRSSNNLAGAFMGPVILATLATSMLIPGGFVRLVLHGAMMLALGIVVLVVSLRFVSLERYAL